MHLSELRASRVGIKLCYSYVNKMLTKAFRGHLNAAEFSLLSEIIQRCNTIIAQFERQRLGIAGTIDSDPDNAKQLTILDRQDGKRKARHHTKDSGFVKAQFKLTSSLVSDLGAEQPLHVSLSRPNSLKTEERARFVDLLEERIHKARLKP